MTNAAIYARVSRDEQAKGYSLPTQIEGCQQLAEQRGYHVSAVFREDHTGTVLDRPELDKVRSLARAGAITKLIVYELDRLARGMAKQIIIEEEFAKWSVCIEYVLTEYDDSPEGRLQKNVRAIIAEYEREKIIERSVRGRKGRAKAGQINPGGSSPYGFRYEGNKANRTGKYVIIPEEARIVMLIYMWYAYGDETGRKLGAPGIAKKLTAMGIPTRYDTLVKRTKARARGEWVARQVTLILTSALYKGVYYFNRMKRDYETGKTTLRDKSEWIAIPVEAIVPEELWEAAQRQRQITRDRSLRNTKGEYLMRRRIRCAKCGYMCSCMPGDRRWKNSSPSYRCTGYHATNESRHGQKCGGTVNSKRVDEVVWDFICRILKSPEAVITSMQEQRAEYERATQPIRERLAIVDDNIAQRTARKARLVDLYLDGKYSKDDLDTRMAEIQADIARFEIERSAFQEKLADAPGAALEPDYFDKLRARLPADLERATFAKKVFTLDMLNVSATIQYHPDHTQTLRLSGYFPDVTLSIPDHNASAIGGSTIT